MIKKRNSRMTSSRLADDKFGTRCKPPIFPSSRPACRSRGVEGSAGKGGSPSRRVRDGEAEIRSPREERQHVCAVGGDCCVTEATGASLEESGPS
ncbi:hypothetical protein Pmani_014533 [Petrolisthes manimaculis]|uniref:Uncharacterized protein n=1 Tax=Petrolisthes manimaculis TaxID=1843537 RepID=A0AAE1U8M2_9EUCA|nr:hypothetical protein Pmani_014533 [Petrolisthes manimaculis]